MFKNITVIQEPGMVVLEVRWDHLPKQKEGNVLSSHVTVEKIGSSNQEKKLLENIYIFLCKISFEYSIGRHFYIATIA